MVLIAMNEKLITHLLKKCWSRESSSLYTQDNPTKGQCSVTALVIQDCYGGQLLKTRVGESWHFYNYINRMRYDLTAEQFGLPIEYLDLAATREEAFDDTNVVQYNYLLNAFQQRLTKQTQRRK
ncbi:MAG: hypothetical protein CLLPBCKN_000532 [Chroococcidiopsis cubana SAG 39.79]|uniref:Uncharacterized protein n=2 Tax=Chroococcidiopsis TaxID=54298 RepID=A0AB37UNW6_9CYAN|nr:hypothetical protein [Chroococcidiopsis cubana]MDZ4871144.1 hypothetical protein [Chroococcidiopsis cubana SAG 39.79]PSB66477.1 hypothetical protein C7B79_01030 [Chroococcidiopsis cubana CCALA 043]RUT13085.1 hypothetical protein DSM107010_16410 [Chroococcidiopsis cubana SAG 39.79]